MAFVGSCVAVHQTFARSQRSLRAGSTALGLPVHRLPADEIDASMVKFAWLARVKGMSVEDVAEAVRNIRAAQAQRHGQEHGDP